MSGAGTPSPGPASTGPGPEPRAAQDGTTSAAEEKAAEKPYATVRTRELEDELATTRAELAATVDALVDRLDPRTAATRTARKASTFVRSAVTGDGPEGARTKVWATLGAVAAVAVTFATVRARRRR